MTRYSLSHLLVPLALSLSLPAVSGCGGGSDDGNNSPCGAIEATATNGIVSPPTIHTGFNGRDEYKAAITTNFGIVDYTSSNEAVVGVEPFGCLGANQFGITGVVTAKGAGMASINVVSGELTRSISVNVTMYSTAQYDTGSTRYNNMVDATPQGRSCASCHVGGGGAPHDPTALAGTPDADLIIAAKTSVYPDTCLQEATNARCNCTPVGTDEATACAACPGGPCAYTPGYVLDLSILKQGEGPGEHVFTMTLEEETGLMAYMRSLKPTGI